MYRGPDPLRRHLGLFVQRAQQPGAPSHRRWHVEPSGPLLPQLKETVTFADGASATLDGDIKRLGGKVVYQASVTWSSYN